VKLSIRTSYREHPPNHPGGRVEVSRRRLLMAPHKGGAYYDIWVADIKVGATPCVPLAKTMERVTKKVGESETEITLG